MIAEVITLGLIGVASYVTGDSSRKSKIRQIGSDIVDVAKDVAASTVQGTKDLVNKIKSKCQNSDMNY